MQVQPGLNVVTVAETCFLLRLGELLTRLISPATLPKKGIPDRNFLFAGPPATREAPLEDFFTRTAFQRSVDKLIVIYSQKPCATGIEVRRIFYTGKISRRQFARCFQPDLVQHSSKINQAFCFNVIGTRSLSLHLRKACDPVPKCQQTT